MRITRSLLLLALATGCANGTAGSSNQSPRDADGDGYASTVCTDGAVAAAGCLCGGVKQTNGYCCGDVWQAGACSVPPLSACATEQLRTTGTIYYYCDCATGLLGGEPDPACVAGDDNNAGTSPSFPRRSIDDAVVRFNSMAAGNTVALCRGGVWSGGGALTNTNCTSANTCDLRDYIPSWGSASTPRPRLSSGSGTLIYIGDGSRRGNYRIWNLDLRNNTPSGANGVIFLYNSDLHDIDFCNMQVRGGWLGINVDVTSTAPANVTIRDSQIYDGGFSGFYGGSPGISITGNYFEGNGINEGSGGMLMHSAYLISELGGTPSDASSPTPYTFSNNTLVEGDYCDGVILVVHGVFRNNHLVIENNNISTTSTKPQCYGFQTAGGYAGAEFHNVSFKRNRITTPGQTAVEFSCCADCTLSDNIIVNGGVGLSTSDCNAGSFKSGAQVIQNNTLYNTGLEIGSVGTGPYDLDNNAVWRDGGTCYSTQQVGRNNNNYCRTSGAAATDVFVDPAGGDFTPAPGSPLIGTGNSDYYSPLAIGTAAWTASDTGVARTPPIDAGAMRH